MTFHSLPLSLLSLSLIIASTDARADFRSVADRGAVSVSLPCQGSEKWSIQNATNPTWLNQYQDFVGGKLSSVYSFSQAVQLKKLSALLVHSDFERDFSEFWVGRILYDMKLDALAQQVFRSVYENSETPMIKKASFVCMTQIQKRSPDWKVPSGSDWMGLALDESDADAILIASLQLPSAKMANLAKKLPESHRSFLLGVDAVQKRKYNDAITQFTAFIDYFELHSNAFLTRYKDDARLYLGRAYYSVAKFKEAAEQFQKIKKTSNQQIDALSDLSWAYLLDENYDAAIGIAMQLRAGSLHNTFSPEPLMVAAMALNELCLYPDSVRMMRSFVNDYGKSFEWLTAHPNAPDLYSEVLKVLKKQSTVPAKVATEWLKNPAFLTRQMELNQLIESPKRLADIQKKAALEQDQLTLKFIEKAQKFVKDVRVAKLKLKPGEELAADYGDQYLQIKRELRNLTRYYKASKIWKNLAKNFEKRVPSLRTDLVEKVNADLKDQNKQLLTLLNKVRENSDLIEVEIYNGASQDMIWKNAHPDFEGLSQDMNDQKQKANSAQVWDWGRMLASEIENAEVWEDEMGALKADISDQCDKRDRYLQLKAVKR
jgi:tetratricopeptide (TPR) repeat protein